MKNIQTKSAYYAAAALAVAALATVSCDKGKDAPDTVPPVEVVDQIQYNGGAPVDIESAIYSVRNLDEYTFYLSPVAEISDVAGMEASEADYLTLTVTDPSGEVDTENDNFSLSYRDIAAGSGNLDDVEDLTLSAELKGDVLDLNLEVTMTSGKTLVVKYNASCIEADAVKLSNQYELNGNIFPIGSVTAQWNPEGGVTTYSFYEDAAPAEDGVAGLVITVAEGENTINRDLSDVEAGAIVITSGAFSNEESTVGTMLLSVTGTTGVALNLTAENSGGKLRATFSGAMSYSVQSENTFSVTENENESESALNTVFLHTGTVGSTVFMLGDAADVQSSEDLKTGHYAVKLSIPSTSKDNHFEISETGAAVSLYDYETYSTYNSTDATGAGAEGYFDVYKITDDSYYLKLSVTYPQGPSVESEWYGTVSTSEENTDLVPVEPFTSKMTVTTADNEVILDKAITALEVRKSSSDKDMWTGDMLDGYFFYFRTDLTDNIDNDALTPVLFLPEDCLNGSELDLSAEGDIKWTFSFTYQANGQKFLGSTYGYGYPFSSSMNRTPDNVSASVLKDGDEWSVTFEMTDYIPNTWNNTNNRLLIQWRGPATKYSGTKTNDMTDSDY